MGCFEGKISTFTTSRQSVRPLARSLPPPPKHTTHISLQMSTWLINQYAVRQGLTSKLWHWDGLPPPSPARQSVMHVHVNLMRRMDYSAAVRDHRLSSIIQSVVLLFTANDPDKPPNSHVLRAPRHNPVSAKHLYNICTMLDQRRRRWTDVVQMLYKILCWLGRPARLRANAFHVGPAPRRPLAVRYQWYLWFLTRHLPFWSL